MLYRKMPKSSDKLSILGFGCMRFPVIDNDLQKINEDEAIKMLRYAIDEGVNYIDTAYPYHGTGMGGPGQSEPFVAKALKDGYREKVFIATKLPSWLVESREDMDRFLDHQLQRLETETIDYYLLHALNSKSWSKLLKMNVLDFLDKAIADGRIKYAGFSFHDASVEVFKNIIDAYEWTFCQIQYNYIDENYQAGKEGLMYAANKGVGVIVMEPLKGGSLATSLPEEATEAFRQVDDNKTPAEWSLRWLWNQPEVSLLLSGMSTMDQVVENVKIAGDAETNSLNQEELNTVEKVKSIIKNKVKVDCTTCGYCMPCPNGVDIPQNFTYYNDFSRFDNPNTKMNTKIMYRNGLMEKQKALSCIDCGECESHCPQSIPIMEKLKEVAETMAM